MRIVRYRDESDAEQLGREHEDGSITRIEGTFFGVHEDTGE